MGILITQKNIGKIKEIQDAKNYIANFDYRHFTKEEAEISLKYAENKYDKITKDIEFLDNKSDLIIKFLGLGTGILGVILGYTSKIKNLPLILPFLIGFAFWIVSIILSLLSTKPSAMPYPMQSQKIFTMIKKREGAKKMIIKQALSYMLVGIMLKHIEIKKGALLHLAYIGMVISMSLFFLPIILYFIFGVR